MLSDDHVDAFLSRYVKDGKVISIGTNPLGELFLKKLGLMVEDNRWSVELIPTSVPQMEICQQFHLPTTTLNDREVDICFEFVSQATEDYDFLKRHSSSLIRDKMVAQSAGELIAILPAKDMVPSLQGICPFEISAFGWKRTLLQLGQIGNVDFSQYKNEPQKTEAGHYLVNVLLEESGSAGLSVEELDAQARRIPGVIETGLFPGSADRLILVGETEIRVKSRLDFEK